MKARQCSGWIGAAMMFVLAGCATTNELPSRDARFEVLEERKPRGAVEPESLYASEAFDAAYLIAASDDAGGQLIVRRKSTDRFDAAWADHEGEERTDFWRAEGDGSIVLCAVIDRNDNAISLFDPPLLLLPPALQPGEVTESESAMRVVDLRDPRKLREKGTATRRIEYQCDQRIRTTLGEFTAQRLVVRFEASLGLAEAAHDATLFIVPEIGLVAEESEERVKVLGLAGSATARRIVLIEKP